MKISEVVEYLKRVKGKHGDLDVYQGYEGLTFPLEQEDVLIVKVRAARGEKDPSKTVCLFGHLG